jgi:hypothetical protein
VATSGTIIPAGTYTITASATPNFSITRDNSPGVNLTAGTGVFDGITLTEVYRYTIAGGLMGINDFITGNFISYYGGGSTTNKRTRILFGNGTFTVVNFSISNSGVGGGDGNFKFRNKGSLSSQLYTQTFSVAGPVPTSCGTPALASLNTAVNHDMTVTLQKDVGTDALSLWALRVDLERI